MKMTSFIVLLLMGRVVLAGDGAKFFETPAEVVKYFKAFESSSQGFVMSASRGGGRSSTIVTTETRWYHPYTYDYLGSTFSWSQYSCNTCGTVIPYPESDFTVVDSFEYKDPAKSQTQKFKGLFVVVKIGIESTSSVSRASRLRAMKNLVEAGGNYKDENNRPRRLRPLNRTLRSRYRFCSLKTYYSTDSVGFVLFDVDDAAEDKSISAATFAK